MSDIPQPTTVQLAPGRAVGLYQFGDESGVPVLAFHGVPSCGAAFVFANEAARARGIRLIAPDRPGVGLSSAQRGYTVSSYPDVVAELADVLGLERFPVWGYSGGGPYAVACAARLPGRVTRAAVCAGMGEVGEWASDADFEKTDRQMLGLARRRPRVAGAALAAAARLARIAPNMMYKSFVKELSASDCNVIEGLGRPPAEIVAQYGQAFLRGSAGVVDDYRALGQPWNLALDRISIPTRIYQGDADTMVPPRHSKELANRVPHADLVEWPGEGHLGPISHVEEILAWLTGQHG